MDPEQAISTALSVVTAIKEIKGIIDKEPSKRFWLLPNKNKDNLQSKINFLEEKVNTGFSSLAQLVRSYSSVISEVKVAKAISDKASEMVGAFPDLPAVYINFFVLGVENNHARIGEAIGQLPEVNNAYEGQLNQKLSSIRDRIRDLKTKSRESIDDRINIQRLFDEVSTDYTDTQRILSQLLETIITSLDVS